MIKNIIIIFIVGILSCGATNDSPDAPTNVEIGVIYNPLNPTTDLQEYRVCFFLQDTTTIDSESVLMVVQNGRMFVRLIAPQQFTEQNALSEPAPNDMIIVSNDHIIYGQDGDKWNAYFEFDLVGIDKGYYEVRVKTISIIGKHGKLSAPGKNYILIQ